MCKMAEYLGSDLMLNFTQKQVAYFRRRIVLELANTSLLGGDKHRR